MSIETDETIEERISMEILVDAYEAEEQAMGWFYYLQDTITFPFKAKCITKRKTSPIKVEQIVEAIGMADEEDCMHEMFVEIYYEDDVLSIPLAQIEAIDVDEETQQAIGDWHYWVRSGREL
jgi:hypothetical protein